ncbi:conserved hypothetical protein [Leishmania mexicana MHOM/GT/2001/U1103]|uniref:Uncharacterized protein n=1 Tax=Leishmania mexicana (strain MHOM/GT/2001/U1103) TaxID=929439 RepID=E9AVZ3_LEIMU|nr:conserved hypothetical protein [Leishmania mexicana MHOM/GT/2001/U1103]CBZ27126.1 conserved hypothetical protein [Leishmania mexicana MHOM/GT/2001/U1103]
MAVIATLPEANYTHLLYIGSDVVAACDRKAAHLVQYRGDTKVDEATCISPYDADNFVPWLPPGAPVARVRAVWCMRKGQGYAVFAERAGEGGTTVGTSPDAASVKIISDVAENIISLHIFYQSILAVRTLKQVLFYSLDPSPSAMTIATRIGACALPRWVCQPAVVVDIVSPVCHFAAAEKTICVACFTLDRMFVATVVCPSSASAAVVRRTAMSGVLFSSSPASDSAQTLVCKWAVRWCRQEMLMLCFSKADRGPRLTGFFLQPTRGCEMSKWMSPEEVATSVSGASLGAVKASSDICCDSDGAHVWLCDTTTASSVILREVTTVSPTELVLTDTSASTRVAMATGASGVFVLSGCTLYSVKRSHVGATSESASTTVTGTSSASSPGSASIAAVGNLSRKQEARVRKESSAAETITRKAAASERSPLSAHTLSTPLQPAALTEAAAVPISRSAQIKDAVLEYAMGHTSIFSDIVRDTVYVHESGSATSGAAFTHDILSAINERLDADRHQHALARIRYSAVARSLHPYTVLELLRFRRGSSAEAMPEGLLLAIASTLAEKPTLQNGGLWRLPAFAAASAAFFASTGGSGRFTSELETKRYVADVCDAAKAALASGALGAARLLFTVAARAVSLIYGGTRRRHVEGAQPYGKEEQMCEVTIAECISLMRSYVEWSLTASSSLGVMSAHVGAPHTLTKEAALRDGEAHLISTSRQVQIHPMQVSRLPKKSI